MFIQLSVHPVTQLVLIQSSDSFLFFTFSFLLIFFFIRDLYFDEGLGGGEGVEPRLGVKRIFVLDPTGRIWSVSKSELESGMRQFQHKQAQKFSLLADWKQKKKKKGQDGIWWTPTQWGTKAFRPLFLFCFGFVCFSLETCSFSWDLKWTHVCAVLVLPYSFQVL